MQQVSQDGVDGSQDIGDATPTASDSTEEDPPSGDADNPGQSSEDPKPSGAKRKYVDPEDYFPEKWPPPTPWPGVPRTKHPIVYADEVEEWIPGKCTRSTQTTPTKGYSNNPYVRNIRLSTKQKEKLKAESEAAKRERKAKPKLKPQFRKFKL